MNMIMKSKWSQKHGKLPNPGKAFFLKLAVKFFDAVSQQRDESGLPYARKARIRVGMALSVKKVWQGRQLVPNLQKIVGKHH